MRLAHARQGTPALARRTLFATLAARLLMMDEQAVRIETNCPIEDVVRRLREAIACNRLRSPIQPQLAGTVTPEHLVLRRNRPLFSNRGYPIFRGRIYRENGRTVIEGRCKCDLSFLWFYYAALLVIVVIGAIEAILMKAVIFLLFGLLVAGLGAALFAFWRRAAIPYFMGDVELLIRDVRNALQEAGGN